MNNRFPLLLLLVGLICSSSLSAQGDEGRDNVPPRLRNQQDEFENGNYMFPAQKRANWAVGVMIGGAFASSDVKAMPGYGLGLNVQKALGHTFSLRGQATGGVMAGQNYQYSHGYFSGLNRNPWVRARGTTPTTFEPGNGAPTATSNAYWDRAGSIDERNRVRRVYYNYRCAWYDVSVQGVANLNNINFYKEQSKWNLYAAAGPGFMMYHTLVDALDDDNKIYDFYKVKGLPQNYTNFFRFPGVRNDAITEQFDLRGVTGYTDNLKKAHYESWAENHADEQTITLGTFTNAAGDKEKRVFTVNPFVSASAGILYRIGRRIEVGVEHRIAWTNDDLLDGQRWQENGVRRPFNGLNYVGNTALTRDFDSYHYTALIFNLRLGKGEDSYWWQNPLAQVYGSVADTRKMVKNMSEDDDGDGVPNLFDQEPDTPDGEMVDSKGRTLDSDEDGIPDSGDEQKFTPKDCPVDNRGVALDGDDDNVPDCFDAEPNSAPGAFVDAKGRTIPKMDCKDCTKELEARIKKLEDEPRQVIQANTGGIVKDPCALPSVHFDLDRTNIKQEFYPQLYQVARYMLEHPEVRIRVSGFTDRGGEAVARQRVENTINFLIGNFGIDRGRFEMVFAGVGAPGVYTGGGTSGKNPTSLPLDYMNRRVDFSCIE